MNMRAIYTALNEFWSQAGVPAYPQNMVPLEDEDDAIEMPYIAYSVPTGPFSGEVQMQAFAWTKSEGLGQLADIGTAVANMIPEQGTVLQFDGGALWVYRGTPFIQDYPQEDRNVKASYINTTVRCYAL